MKYQIISLAVLALLTSSTQATHKEKSLTAMAEEDDKIEAGSSEWNDVGYIQASKKNSEDLEMQDDQDIGISSLNKEKNKIIVSEETAKKAEEIREKINEREGSDQNKKLFANINEKLTDKSFIETAIQNTAKAADDGANTNTHTPEYETNDWHSDDLYHNDFGGRDTERLGEYNKEYEDNFHEGVHNTGGTSELKFQEQKILPKAWEKFGPTNVPKHLQKGDFKKSSGPESDSATGVLVVYLVVDNDEHGTRFVKAMFNKGLIAAANQYDSNFERSFLKLGRLATERLREKLELFTTSDKVAELIDYINNNNPTNYDYPVPNTVAIPVSNGNPKFIAWVKKTMAEPVGMHVKAKADAPDSEETDAAAEKEEEPSEE